MTPVEHLELAAMYSRKLTDRGVEAVRTDTADISGDALAHAAWMCGEITRMAHRVIEIVTAGDVALGVGVTYREEWIEARILEGKCNRWLGFVQAILWLEEIFTIDQLRDHVRLDEAALAHVSGKDDEEPEREPS